MNPTQNGVLQHDDNGYPVMGGTSSLDDSTIINAAFDPVTRRLLTDSAGSGGTPGGNNTDIQFNDSGTFGGNDKFTWNDSSELFTTPNIQAYNSNGLSIKNSAGSVAATIGLSNSTDLTVAGNVTGANLSGTNTGDQTTSGTANRITVSNGTTNPVVDIAATYVGQTSITTLGTIATGTWQGSSISTTYTDAKVVSVSGTTNRISVGGTASNPTVDIAATYVGQSSITTLGTIATGTWNGTTVGVAYGGTGQTTYTDGQLLIGNSSGNTLTKATLTAGSGISITNGNGSITIAASGSGGTPGGSNTQVQYNNSGAFGGISGFTTDGTNVTAGSGNLRATSPRITTALNDANGNGMVAFSATGSAANYFKMTNAASGAPTFGTNSGAYGMYLTGGLAYLEITGDGTSSSSERLTLTINGGSDPTFTTNLSNSSIVLTPNGTGQVKFGKNASPNTNDGAALGTTSLSWSDLFLASGAVINIANSNWVATHTSGILTIGTGTLKISNPTNNSTSVVTTDGTQTLSAKRVTKRVTTVNAPGATPSTNTDNLDIAKFTGLNAAITSMTTNLSGTPNDGDMVMFQFLDDGTGRAITWGTSFASTTVTLPTTTVASTMLRVLCQWSSNNSKWNCIGTA